MPCCDCFSQHGTAVAAGHWKKILAVSASRVCQRQRCSARVVGVVLYCYGTKEKQPGQGSAPSAWACASPGRWGVLKPGAGTTAVASSAFGRRHGFGWSGKEEDEDGEHVKGQVGFQAMLVSCKRYQLFSSSAKFQTMAPSASTSGLRKSRSSVTLVLFVGSW